MTPDAWLAGVGGSWRRLLLYPGGLTALALAAAVYLLWRLLRVAAPLAWSRGRVHGWHAFAVAGPLLAIGSLPLPTSTELFVPLDLPTLLLLLEIPTVLSIAAWIASGEQHRRASATVALIGLLAAAPGIALLIPAFFTTAVLLSQLWAPPSTYGVVAMGVCWLLLLPPLVGARPWYAAPPAELGPLLALWLRRAGHIALATLPFLNLWPDELPAPLDSDVIRDRLSFSVTFALIALLVALQDRLLRRLSMRAAGYLALIPAAGLLIIMLSPLR